ncbi:nonsense-mediated mRNA decay protein 2 [Monosporozyma servazzii]
MDNAQRLELYELNSRAWDGEEVFPLKSSKLDSSIKKNTGFIKKLKKGVTKESKESLLNDLKELSLEKYMSELTTTASDLLWNVSIKNENIVAVVEVISAIHQRFNLRFTSRLFEQFLANFVNPPLTDKEAPIEKDEILRLTKLKARVTLLTELYLVGVFTSTDIIEDREIVPPYLQRKISKREPFIFTILKELLNFKFKYGFTTIIATHFIRKFPTFFDNDDHSWDMFICDESLKSYLQSLFKIFSDAVMNKTVDLSKRIHKLYKEHQKCQIRTGKLIDEYIEEHDLLVPVFDRFKEATDIFVEFFQLEPPVLIESIDIDTDEPAQSIITNQLLPPSERLWESDEMKRFYENLPDIEEVVTETQKENTRSDAEAMNKFFVDLELVDSKDAIDNLANEYWKLHLDNKATRNRLLKFFIETQDWSKIKIYSRFLAANNKYFPEIIEDFIKYLDNGFRSQLHSNKINVKNIIFFSEMVKFMLVPSFIIFHKIRTLIINLQIQNNVEILTIFFEHAGKFLVHKHDYKVDMEKMVQLLRSKAKDRQLGMNLKSAIDNTLTLLFPPSVSTLNKESRELSNEEKFYHIVIRSELAQFNAKGATTLLRRASWDDSNVYKTMFNLFTEVDKMNYQNIPILAQVLCGLYPYHKNFVIKVIDQTIENIERGLEINEYGDNMARVVQVRYLTEIFNMQMIKSDVLLDIIFLIIKFNYPNNQPLPGFHNPMDPPDNYFRIQLVTTALLNIRRFPSVLNKSLELLLRFFEYYTFVKQQPLPVETQFKIKDTFEKFHKTIQFERVDTLMESASRLQSLIQSMHSQSKSVTRTDVNETATVNGTIDGNLVKDDEDEDDEENDEPRYSDDDDEDEDGDENEETDILKAESTTLDGSPDSDESGSDSEYTESDDSDEEGSTGTDDSDDSDDDSTTDLDDSEDEDIDVDRNIELERMRNEYEQKLQSSEEKKVEEELEKQFQLMMNESIAERKSEKVFASSLPIMSTNGGSKMASSSVGSGNAKKVAFTFLTKAGKKTNTRTVELPKNIQFVSNVLEEEEKLKGEREKIKKIVLQRSFD